MYSKTKPITMKSSTSNICNNLTVLSSIERGVLNYAVVHKYLVNMVCTSTDGTVVTHKQVIYKEPSAAQPGNSMIMQAKWVNLKNGRSLLVVTALKGIQIFEHDGAVMVYWHALGDIASSEGTENVTFARGIAGAGESLVFIGTQEGEILAFDIPVKGTNVQLAHTLKAHTCAVTDITSSGDYVVSADEDGNIIMWKVIGTHVQQCGQIAGNGEPCSSVALWKGIIVAAFGNGQLVVYDFTSGKIGAIVNAHARWINAIDVAKNTGLVLSTSEDSFVRVWQLIPGSLPSIEFKFADVVTDQQLVGAKFIQDDGKGFCVVGYDNPDLILFVQ